VPMNARTKFILLIFALTIPYLAFVMYYAMQFPSNHVPEWFANTAAIWFCSIFIVAMIASKRIFGGAKSPAIPPPLPSEKRLFVQIAMWVSTYLVVVWIGFFIYGILEVARGEVPVSEHYLLARCFCSYRDFWAKCFQDEAGSQRREEIANTHIS
jgi:hypothetical protein